MLVASVAVLPGCQRRGKNSDSLSRTAAARLQFVGQPTDTAAGAVINPAVRVAVLNAKGEVIVQMTGDVTLELADNQVGAVLLGTKTVTLHHGVATFSDLNIKKASTDYTLVAQLTNLGSTSDPFDIRPAAIASIELAGIPPVVTAGVQQDITATVLDGCGNVVTEYRGTMGFASSDTRATLPPPYTFTETDQGVHRFPRGVVFRNVGSQTVDAQDAITVGVKGRHAPVDVINSDCWRSLTNNAAPAARNCHTAVWTGSRMIIWGGFSNTGGLYDPIADVWTGVTNVQNAPAARSVHTAVWTGSEMIVWGGLLLGNGVTTHDGGRYDPVTDAWVPLSTVNAPVSRLWHTAVWTGSEMIVWGGERAPALGPKLNDGGRYDPATDRWTALPPCPIVPRANHTAVWTGSEMIVFAGINDNYIQIDDGAAFNPGTGQWRVIGANGAPFSRAFHTAVWTGAEMIVFGGLAFGQALGDGARYEPTADRWFPINLDRAPGPRGAHVAVWTGREMIVWGGLNGALNDFADGARYDPARDRWVAMTDVDRPTQRGEHTAVWIGDLSFGGGEEHNAMVVWGGLSQGAPVGTGGRYYPLCPTNSGR